MGVRHERRKLVLHPEELVNRIIMPLPFLAFDLLLAKTSPARGWKVFAKAIADRPDTRAVGPDPFSSGRIPSADARAIRRQFPVMTGDTELLDQPEVESSSG